MPAQADELRRLLGVAGFGAVALETRGIRLRCRSARDLVLSLAAGGSSMRRVMAAVPLERRAAVLADVEGALAPFAGPDGLDVPQECHYALARA